MKIITTILILISLSAKSIGVVNVLNDTTITGTWNLQGKLLRISGKISGTCTIQNAIIEANRYVEIFDTTVTLSGCKTYELSAIWYGANPNKSSADNYKRLQLAIDMAVANNIWNCVIPTGRYNCSNGLKVVNMQNGEYAQVTLNLYGEGDIWRDATTILFQNTSGYGIATQLAKGGSIHNLRIDGKFKSPVKVDSNYYKITRDNYNDVSGNNCAKYNNYKGLVIDYNVNYTSSKSGSSGLKVYDMYVHGFDILYAVSLNGSTDNADVIMFRDIQLGDGRIGFAGGQAQEKGNVITNIVAWGSLHTLFNFGDFGKTQTGGYTIYGGNVAGAVIQLFEIQQKGWFGSNFYNLYAESIGRLGIVTGGDQYMKTPTTFTGCNFDFALKSEAGEQSMLQSSNNSIVFNSCRFRYYGPYSDVLNFSQAKATFINCDIPNPIIKNPLAVFYAYPLPYKDDSLRTPLIKIKKG